MLERTVKSGRIWLVCFPIPFKAFRIGFVVSSVCFDILGFLVFDRRGVVTLIAPFSPAEISTDFAFARPNKKLHQINMTTMFVYKLLETQVQIQFAEPKNCFDAPNELNRGIQQVHALIARYPTPCLKM